MRAILTSLQILKIVGLIKSTSPSLNDIKDTIRKDLEKSLIKRFDSSYDLYLNSLETQTEIIYHLSRNKNGKTRRELVEKTKSKRTTIYDNLDKLRERGFITYKDEKKEGRGRPKRMWVLDI